MSNPSLLQGLVPLCTALAVTCSGSLQAMEPPRPGGNGANNTSGDWVHINSKRSLANLESIDSYGITERGTQAAKLLLAYLQGGSSSQLDQARNIYESIIPIENYGGDYTAMQWFCDYFLADAAGQRRMRADPLIDSYFIFLTENRYERLSEYLQRKYRLKPFADSESEAGRNRLAFLEDFILFYNPRRENWEQTSKILDFIKLKPGNVVADIGSGPGYYSFKFAKRVGPSGRVYAIDTVKAHLEYLNSVARRTGVTNIQTINNHNESLELPANQLVDVAFMCSLYHIIYIVYREAARENFIASIKSALKPDGRLVIVDNSVVEGADRPYHGPYIAKELIVAQLKHYGFQLEDSLQPVAQRFVLSFRLKPQS
jgi:ubiquinone/menaquinone biosynthesis C-methylase UbiE